MYGRGREERLDVQAHPAQDISAVPARVLIPLLREAGYFFSHVHTRDTTLQLRSDS